MTPNSLIRRENALERRRNEEGFVAMYPEALLLKHKSSAMNRVATARGSYIESKGQFPGLSGGCLRPDTLGEGLEKMPAE
jgi:hypothetical protein